MRVPIPAGVQREIYVEAGYRCSLARCPHEIGLEIHHIDEDPSNNAPGNLLLLCANHHSLATAKKIDRKACAQIKGLLPKSTVVDEEKLARLLALHLASTGDWPDPLGPAEHTPQELASRIALEVGGRVEVLGIQRDQILIWLKVGQWLLPQIKNAFLAIACLLSEEGNARVLEIGLSNTADFPNTVGGSVGNWRVRIDLLAARHVARSKHVGKDFWSKVRVLITAGDNFRTEQVEISFDDFEARA